MSRTNRRHTRTTSRAGPCPLLDITRGDLHAPVQDTPHSRDLARPHSLHTYPVHMMIWLDVCRPHTRLHHDCIQMGPLAHISSCRRPVWDGWALQSRPAPSLALHPSSHCSHPWAVGPPSRWPAGNGWAHRSGPFADPTPVQANSSAPSCTPITHTSSCRRPVGNGWAYQTGPLMADSTHPR